MTFAMTRTSGQYFQVFAPLAEKERGLPPKGSVSAFQALTTAAHSFAWSTPQIRPSQYTAHHPIFLFSRASRFRYEGNWTGNPYHGYRRGSLFVQLLVLL